MSFRWIDYLGLAAELSGAGSSDPLHEAKWRSAISRAYYAAFHLARAHHASTYGPPPRHARPVGGLGGDLGPHEALIRSLTAGRGLMAAKLAVLLSDLKDARVRADYRAEAPMDASTARAAVSLARAIAQLIETAPR